MTKLSSRTRRLASAPGKLLIAGEYAVLEGHPALVTSTSRRAHARLSAVDDDSLCLQLPDGLLCRVTRGREGLSLSPSAPEALLLLALLQTLDERQRSLPTGLLEVDTAGFYLGVDKLGLGSSAAVCASVAALLVDSDQASSPALLHALADEAHTRFSGPEGKGSGIDVAASCFGGTFRFTRTAEATSLTPWTLCPEGVDLIVGYAGSSTSTRHFLREIRACKARDGSRYDEAIALIAAATKRLLEATEGKSGPEPFFEALEECRTLMQRLGDLAGLDIVSAPHRRIAAIASTYGGAAKPSGAGGGDVAICFVPREAAQLCREQLRREGFPVVEPLTTGAPGAQREHSLT
ncbi:MAG: mevalonate kinase family protein [Myxococcota bacterium]